MGFVKFVSLSVSATVFVALCRLEGLLQMCYYGNTLLSSDPGEQLLSDDASQPAER